MDGRSYEGLSSVLIPVLTDERTDGGARTEGRTYRPRPVAGHPCDAGGWYGAAVHGTAECPGVRRAGGTMPIQVLIVDDHSVVRRGLRMFLEDDPERAIAGEARDGAAAITQAHPPAGRGADGSALARG